MKRIILALVILLGLSVATKREAHATAATLTGYVCKVVWYNTTNVVGIGNYGGLYVLLSTMPQCGTTLSQHYLCTTGGNGTVCDTTYLYSEAQMVAIFRGLLDWMAKSKQVTINYDTGVTLGIRSIEFKDNW